MSYLITQSVFASWGCRVFRTECFQHWCVVRRKLTLAERWQAVDMSQASFCNRGVTGQMGVHYSDRFMQRLQTTGVVERPRSGRPRKTTHTEDRLIARCTRIYRIATSDIYPILVESFLVILDVFRYFLEVCRWLLKVCRYLLEVSR